MPQRPVASRFPVRLTGGVLSVVLVAGCTDAPSTVPDVDAVQAPHGNRVEISPRAEFDSRPRFGLEVDAKGSFRPGHPIHFTLAVLANEATADGEIRLTLPEVASAEDSGWDVVVTPANRDLRSHIRVRKAFATGESLREHVTLTIPEPGYYHAVATGYAHHDSTTPGPHSGGDVSRRDFWIWVDENGGRVTAQFDTTLFAPGFRKQLGPRSSEKKRPRLRSEDATPECSVWPEDPVLTGGDLTPMSPCPGVTNPDPPPPPPSATASFRFSYVDAGAANALRPVSGARYIWKVLSTTGAELAQGSGQLGPDGASPIIDCGAPAGTRQLKIWMYTLNERAYVGWGAGTEASNAGFHSGMCGGHLELRGDAEMSHLFLNLVRTAEGHRNRFGTYPDRVIYAGLYSDTKTYYDHDHPDGELHIYKVPRMIYGEYGIMVAAHEYGHYWQDRRLFQSPAQNGLMRYTSNCAERHPPASLSNLGCAVGEAFADWYAVIVRENDMPGWKADLETNRLHLTCQPGPDPDGGTTVCTDDGSIVQGAVSALFWDIVDGNWESHDGLQASPRQLTDAITNCSVKIGSSFVPYTGVDHLIYCMERRSPYNVVLNGSVVRLFNTRTTLPIDASGTGLFSGNLSFRKMWLVNLYSKRSTVGTSPNPGYSLEPSPDPEPGPEPLPCNDCVEPY